jgi:hypothetical protein
LTGIARILTGIARIVQGRGVIDDDDAIVAAPAGARSAQRCSYCNGPGHRAPKCPERRAMVRAERLLVIEARAPVLAAAGRLKLGPAR